MYTLTRAEASQLLQVSTRSVDRYIKSGKIRTKKEWKIIYLHKQDVENIASQWDSQDQEVIIPQKKSQNSYTYKKQTQEKEFIDKHPEEKSISKDYETHKTLEKIYIDLKYELKEKDKTIQDLSLRLGQAQEIAKNSVSLIEFKKSQYLLEESKSAISQEVEKLQNTQELLQEKIRYEKTSNYILLTICIFLILAIALLWFYQI